ncbi:sensor domain-containing diguanylate cyclase [Aestuariibacter halophilus]|uniref:diguanylate cyclase n=1 Tax=Fluctibacter halophilus TaxID=226011 RepID=A0ABS8GBL9_9ALTE|nr:diguanylate cyclase [Aestuariibacter halophilus]MCC2617124.1 sensor domain-containing diguanylate cyclase [Aestuariibacter halophilus]
MSIFRTLHRSILFLFAIVVIAIITLAHFSVSKIVAEQSRIHQQSLSPALSLITEHLMKPLHVSQTLSKSKELQALMEADTIDATAVHETLQRLEKEFGFLFFIASEPARRQYNSDGSEHALVEGKVNWYFKYKDKPENAVADIGKWEDTHFYIDLKIYDDQERFLGFFGTGKSLRSFLDLFAQYKQQYGYDFIFVDADKNITLSSDPDLVAANSKFHHLADLAWYREAMENGETSVNNRLIEKDGKDFLVAEINIQPFDWTMYLLSPLSERQTALSRTFIFSIISLLVVIFALFMLIYNLLYYFKRDMQRNVQIDPLTKLPNRNKVELRYAELVDQKRPIAVILLDIDHFKAVNDTHGHNAGDHVLRQVASMLDSQLREEDIIGRWGGEEFVILLPDTTPEQAYEVAQKLRLRLANMTASTGSLALQITASFGVSYTEGDRPLVEVLARADDALYQAKRDGRNQVRVQLTHAA